MRKEFNEAFGKSVLSLATIWKISRQDGVSIAFTNHTEDLIIDGLRYMSDASFTPSSIESSNSLKADNLEIEGVLSSYAISEEDLSAGLYDYAEIEVLMVDYTNVDGYRLQLKKGRLGEVSFTNSSFRTEIQGLMQSYGTKVGDLYSPSCRALVCDDKCKVNMDKFSSHSSIISVMSDSEFIIKPVAKDKDYFAYGILEFLSGKAKGVRVEIKSSDLDFIEASTPIMQNIAEGDEIRLVAGCNKSFKTCVSKFDNAINFRGEPHVPGSKLFS